MANYSRIHRLLKILTLVQSGQKCKPNELAKECGVKERTIFRDLNELEGAGFKISFDTDSKQYKVGNDCFLPPISLTTPEAVAMAAVCQHIAEAEQIPFTRPAWNGLAKVQAAMPESVRSEISAISKAIVIKIVKSEPQDGFEDIYNIIQHAISDRKTLVCKCDSLDTKIGSSPDFDFEPYALYYSVSAWYAIGYHHEQEEIQTLKLSKLIKAVHTHRSFVIPEGFTIDTHFGNAWRIMGGTDESIELLITPEFAETISDTTWHKTQEIEDHVDGSATMRCTVSGLDEIVWWILSMGPNCKVIKPEALKERVRDLCNSTAGLYK